MVVKLPEIGSFGSYVSEGVNPQSFDHYFQIWLIAEHVAKFGRVRSVNSEYGDRKKKES